VSPFDATRERRLRDEGFCVLPDVLDPERVAQSSIT
jgi:hypothetical protein